MRISLNIKKTIFFIVSLVILFIITGSVVLFVYPEYILKVAHVDQFNDVLSECEIGMDGLELDGQCKAFIDGIEKNDTEIICLRVHYITKDMLVKQEKVCGTSEQIVIENESVFQEKKVAVDLNLKYSFAFPFSYNFTILTLSLMDETETTEILSKLNSKGITIENVSIESTERIHQNGYYSASFGDEDLKVSGAMLLNFREVNITNLSETNGKIKVNLDIMIDQEVKSVTLYVDRFWYMESFFGDSQEINLSNIGDIDLGKKYSAQFIYFPADVTPNIESIKEYCNRPDSYQFAICDITDPSTYLVDIDEYISQNFTEGTIDKILLDHIYLINE